MQDKVYGTENVYKKSKTTAVLLAVFLGFWAWLYLYKKSKWKFWLNLSLTLITLGFWSFVSWIWAIIDTAQKSDQWYEYYHYSDNIADPIPVEKAIISSPAVSNQSEQQIIGLPADKIYLSACRLNRFFGTSVERGLIAVDKSGITYITLAESPANKVILIIFSVIITCIFVLLILANYNYGLLSFPALFLAWIFTLPVTAAMNRRAQVNEEIVKNRGIDFLLASSQIQPYTLSWNEVRFVSVGQIFTTARIVIVTVTGPKLIYLLLGKDKVFNVASKAEAVNLLKRKVGSDSLGKLK